MIVIYIYTKEIKQARLSGNWNAVFAGLTLFGVDFFNETWNGWVMHFTQRSALWTTPGETALRVMVGWNIEIIFMFLLAGIVYYHTLSESTTRNSGDTISNSVKFGIVPGLCKIPFIVSNLSFLIIIPRMAPKFCAYYHLRGVGCKFIGDGRQGTIY